MSSLTNRVGRGRMVAFLLASLAIAALLAANAALGVTGHVAGAPVAGDSNAGPAAGRSFTPLGSLGRLAPPVFGSNYRANTDNTGWGQHEPGLAVSRVHTNTVVAAAKDYRDGNVKHVWIYGSTDGGVTWPNQLQMPGVPAAYTIQSDPVVIARDDGRIYVACLATNGSQNLGAIYITWTDDDGATWRNPSVGISVNDPGLDDKDWFAIDNNPTSPYYHRMYMMYTPFVPGFYGPVVHYSVDGGVTWSARQMIGSANMEYTYPVVASDGTVYNFMMDNWGGGQLGTVMLTKSTSGGVTWSAPSVVSQAYQPGSPIRGTDSFRFFSIISAAVDPNNGALYAAWTDDRTFNTTGADVLYVKSTDGGTTWTQPFNVAQLAGRPECPGCDNITPMVIVGADSRVHMLWVDRANNPSPPGNGFMDTYYTSSTDGGATWETATRVSTVSTNMNIAFPPGSGNAAGDYWGFDTAGNVVYAAWNDTRNNEQDIWVSRGVMGGMVTPTPGITSTPTATATNIPPTTHTATTQPTTTTPTVTATWPPTFTNTPSPSGTSTTPTNTPTGTPLPACNPVWNYPGVGQTYDIRDVEEVGPHDAWAITERQAFVYVDDAYVKSYQFTPPANSTMLVMSAISAHSPSDLWAAGYYADNLGNDFGIVYHSSGDDWQQVAVVPGDSGGANITSLHSVTAIGPNEAIVVGQSADQPRTWRCTLSGCLAIAQNLPAGILLGVYATGPNNAWAVGYTSGSTSFVAFYDGSSWQPVSVPEVGGLSGIDGSGAGDVWAVGDGGVLHWNGSSWTQVPFPTGLAKSVSVLGPNDVWIAATGNGVWHWDGSTWGQSLAATANANAVSAEAGNDVWVGFNTGIAHYATGQQFEDVAPGSTFYTYVQEMACRGVIAGYPCGGPGEPCGTGNLPYFRPGNNITRAQIAKIVTLAAGITTPVPAGQQTFEDVAPETTFWLYIEQLAGVGALGGYPCGGPGEPCVAPDNRPYFRQNALATRGQLTKIVSQAAGYNDVIPAGTQTFQDVPEGSTFHEYVERLLIHNPNAMSGYPCGGVGEPCIAPQNRPYYRPGNNVTRGQASKIVTSIFYPD